MAKQIEAFRKPGGGTSLSMANVASGAVDIAAAVPHTPVRRLPAEHRNLIVGWKIQVAAALRLQPSTLFTATSLLDRFVAAAEVRLTRGAPWLGKLQSWRGNG